MSKDTAPMTAEEPDTYPMPEHGWTCFFCGETFKKEGTARDHFGNRPGDRPAACLIKAEHNLSMELRRAERERDQARAEAFAAGMEEAAGIAEAEEVPEADDAPSALHEVSPVQAAISAIVVTKACIAKAIRARAAEGAKAEKGDGWRLGPPDAGDLCLMEIEYRVDSHLTTERIVAYVDEQDGRLNTETGDSIGWPSEVVIRHCPLPPAGDPTP